MKHLINWSDWSDTEIKVLLDLAVHVKQNRALFAGYMQGRSLAMIFQKTSTRTRVSFEAGMTEMGGHAIYIDWRSSNFELTEIEYESKYLSRNTALIMARMKQHQDVVRMASSSEVPLINGCCNLYHPCQSLEDLLTIRMDRGSLDGVKLCYVGAWNNVANSLIEITAALGVQLTLVTPIESEGIQIAAVLERASRAGTLTFETNLQKAVDAADYVYTDTWVDMEFFSDPAYAQKKEERLSMMLPYQLNRKLLKNSQAKIMHDMPIHQGYEIEAELVNDPRSLIFQQAENRLDAQKAIILSLLKAAI